MNTHVTFETAKLLKEKGINIYSDCQYTDFNGLERLEKNVSEIFPYAPTIAEVVMWLYEKHGIWVYCIQTHTNLYQPRIQLKGQGNSSGKNKVYNSPTEAYEGVILYILENLI